MSAVDLRAPFASLEGTTGVVTGGGRGIGLEISRALLDVGMQVLVLDRDQEALDEASAALDGLGVLRLVRFDVAGGEGLAEVEAALDALPPMRLWVNNAGVVSHQEAPDIELAEVDRVFGVNTTGVIRGSQLAFSRMADRGGAIVNIGSVAVDKVLPKRLTYAASKAAVLSITQYATQDFGPRGVRVNAISPGYIDTRLTTNWAPDDPRELAKQETIARIPARRTGQPSEIAMATLFLASDLAAYIHGEVVHVDGGWHLV